MKSFFGKTLFPYAVTLFGYCFAYFFRSYLHFYDKPSGEMFVSLFLVAASTFAFGKIIRRNPKLRSLVLLLIPLALFSLNGFFWFYSQSDFLLVYNYAALISLGASLAAAFKFPITEKKFWVHYIIIWFFGGAGFLISFYSKEFDFAGTLICLITLGYVASQWEKSKVTRIGVVVITILLLILSIKNPAPKFFERQDKYEDLVVFSNETEFQTVDITTWKGNYWFYQNGVNHFSSIDSWLYYEPFVYPVLAQNNPQRILIIGGENGMLAAEPKIQTVVDIAHYFGLSIDVLLTKELTVNDLYSLDMVNQKLDDFHKGIIPDQKQFLTKAKLVRAADQVQYLVSHDKKDYINGLPECVLPISTKSKLRLFEMNGEHMVVDRQGIDRGDIMICEQVAEELTTLPQNELVLIVSSQSVQTGRLNTEGAFELIPDNPNFQSIAIESDQIEEIWRVKSNLSLVLHAPKKLADKVTDVESRLLELMQRVDSIEKSSKG